MGLTQKATVNRMLDEAGISGVRSDQFLHVGIPRAAARVGEIKAELEAAGKGTIESVPEKQFCRYIKKLVGMGACGTSAVGAPSASAHSGARTEGRALPGALSSPQFAPELFPETSLERMQDAA